MIFGNPLFLYLGLGAAGLPVAIHLMLRRRARLVPFSSIRFLKTVDRRLARRNRLREILLLALRIAAVALAGLALSRPMSRSEAIPGIRAPLTRIIVVDDSASMQRGTAGNRPFDRARDAVRVLIDDLGAHDRGALATFSSIRRGMPIDLRRNRDALLDDAAGLEPGLGPSDPTPALRAAREAIRDARTPLSEIVVLTDLPRAPWRALLDRRDTPLALRDGEGASGSEALLAPRWRILALDAPEGMNTTLLSAGVVVAPGGDPGSVLLTARVANRSAVPSETRLTLESDGLLLEGRALSLPGLGEETATFTFRPGRPGLHRARLALTSDDLPEDGIRTLLFRTRGTGNILILAREGDRPRYDDPAFYIAHALASDPDDERGPRIEHAPPEGITLDGLSGCDVVILVDPPEDPRQEVTTLRTWVKGGGGLLVFPGASKDRLTLPSPWLDLVPFRTGDSPRDSKGVSGFKLAAAAPDHPLLKGLASTHPPTKLASASLFRILEGRNASIPDASGPSQTLFRFAPADAPSGSMREGGPALVDQPLGEGRVLFAAFRPAPGFTDLPLKVSFIPFLHGAVRYLSGDLESGRPIPAGTRFEPDGIEDDRTAVLRIDERDGATRPAGPDELQRPFGENASGLIISAPGGYLLRRGDTSEDRMLSVFVDPEEGRLDRLSRATFEESWPEADLQRLQKPEDALGDPDPDETAALSAYSTPLLIVAVLLLALEPWVANRRRRTTNKARKGGDP